ncbi:MAG: hypothetical protein R3330_10460, partial [Saprospiraceae bacterium]|nr:hypothetical protein [Saprospiraceae bacterium]
LGQYKPYVGAGIATSRVLERALIYRYEDEQRDLDLSLRYEIPGSEFANEQWLFRAGMDYAFGRHWSLNVEGNYRFGLQPSSPRTLRILGLRSGIYYIF